ncbi:MAG: carboxymuconolactone decarboxylase family protein [Deltaproteobacteria bacterium]|nr:carboxymuconolactone decarboxylase family protein [Deltaproteobacteria bacterium]
MFEEIEEIRRMRKTYNLQMFRSGIGTFRQVSEVEERALKDGELPGKTKELIALGISISKACYG